MKGLTLCSAVFEAVKFGPNIKKRGQKNAIRKTKHILPFLIDFCCCFHVV